MGLGIKDQVGSGNVQLHFDFALLALPSWIQKVIGLQWKKKPSLIRIHLIKSIEKSCP